MTANFSSLRKTGDEPIKIENDSFRILIQMYRKEQEELKNEHDLKDKLNPITSKSENWFLELSIIGTAIFFLILCYSTLKNQGNTDSNDLYRDTIVMKDFILEQVLQTR